VREPAIVRLLPDGRRLHLHDGPIDIVLDAFGDANEIRAAYSAAAKRFVSVLDELCSELALLRQQSRPGSTQPAGSVARRMAAAVSPFAERIFITPMAAVAGAVAEEILGAMTRSAALERAYVNDGGDIALHIAPGQQFSVGMAEYPHGAADSIGTTERPSMFGKVTLSSAQPVRGIATSGWRGRSFSLGIADAVTVLASRASEADAAATVIANAVDLPRHGAIARVAAREIAPDNDLGDLLVTRGVGELTTGEIAAALDAGARVAESLLSSGLIHAAALHLRGETLLVGVPQEFACVAPPSEGAQHMRSGARA
jgi:ApbE superfamily uncharacterized protein (UPF0280 family)